MMDDWRILCGSVQIFFIRDRREILLLKRMNTGFEDGKYGVPAGKMDGSEQVKSAAIREAKEECGVDIAAEDIEVVGMMHRKSDLEWIDFFLVATAWSGEIINMEPDKCEELRWFDLNELPDNTVPHIRQAIDNYQKGTWFDSYGWG